MGLPDLYLGMLGECRIIGGRRIWHFKRYLIKADQSSGALPVLRETRSGKFSDRPIATVRTAICVDTFPR